MARSGMKGTSKEVRKLFRKVLDHDGWTITKRRSGHYLIQGPEDQKVFCGGTPSDHRAVDNIKRDLSKAGLDID